jgi:eukaryotic-like serine/threonine-protein kinase
MSDSNVTPEQIAGEALFILKSLKDNGRSGRSNKLADVKGTLEPSVTLEFDNYFFFLRKYHYIALDREACLQLTTEGERVVEGEERDQFTDAVGEFFAPKLKALSAEGEDELEAVALPPQPPPEVAMELDAGSADATQAGVMPMARPAPRAPRRGEDGATGPRPTLEVGTPQRPAAPPRREPPAPPAPGGQEIDLRYVKFDPIGTGPLGTVYRGRHTALGLDVCVKELKDIFGYFSFLQRSEVIKRLKKELCAQALVRHPSVVGILDQNCDVARPYFVMELCAGGSLRSRLDASGGKGIAADQAIRLFLEICYGLRAAHAAGLIHQNIKPENVLIDHLGNAKISDFGLSRVIETDPSKGMPQVFVGTGGMGYMSPEHLARAKDVNAAADIYSLGIMLYEMLTGQIPGRRSSLPSQANAEVSPKLDPIFDKMTQDRREERYSDIDSVLRDFYAAFDDGRYGKSGDLVLWSESTATAQKPQGVA